MLRIVAPAILKCVAEDNNYQNYSEDLPPYKHLLEKLNYQYSISESYIFVKFWVSSKYNLYNN